VVGLGFKPGVPARDEGLETVSYLGLLLSGVGVNGETEVPAERPENVVS
jgi:hypothetical protein